jgi:hypothetical protein
MLAIWVGEKMLRIILDFSSKREGILEKRAGKLSKTTQNRDFQPENTHFEVLSYPELAGESQIRPEAP